MTVCAERLKTSFFRCLSPCLIKAWVFSPCLASRNTVHMLSPDTDGDAASEGAAEGALDAEGDKKGVEASD
jgi:hypothetical protein